MVITLARKRDNSCLKKSLTYYKVKALKVPDDVKKENEAAEEKVSTGKVKFEIYGEARYRPSAFRVRGSDAG